jgi:hypothetical protein
MWFQAQPTNLIVCLSIPNSQQPIEFCEFVGDEISSVLELKVLMIESPHTYAILMQFETSTRFPMIAEMNRQPISSRAGTTTASINLKKISACCATFRK